jgi:hypothetical protein
MADLMIANVNVGTVVSTKGDVDGTVFGIAFFLNKSTYQHKECIQALKKLCLDKCPAAECKAELKTVLLGIHFTRSNGEHAPGNGGDYASTTCPGYGLGSRTCFGG